jgi:hypothetical protein
MIKHFTVNELGAILNVGLIPASFKYEGKCDVVAKGGVPIIKPVYRFIIISGI